MEVKALKGFAQMFVIAIAMFWAGVLAGYSMHVAKITNLISQSNVDLMTFPPNGGVVVPAGYLWSGANVCSDGHQRWPARISGEGTKIKYLCVQDDAKLFTFVPASSFEQPVVIK